VGTGFLVAPTLVVTAGHVVDGAAAIDLTTSGVTTTGSVIGIDLSTDVALVEAGQSIPGHLFSLAASVPPVGTSLGIIGYPEGGPQSFTEGVISGLDRTVDVEGDVHSGMIQTDAPLNPGNSGGPMFTATNQVVGLVDARTTSAQGLGYGIPATSIAPLISAWEASPSPPAPPSCALPQGPGAPFPVGSDVSGPDAEGIISTLTTYFDAVDTGDYQTAYDQFTPAGQALLGSEPTYALGLATSDFFDITLEAITNESPGVDVATVSFTSVQDPAYDRNGDSCDLWNLAYTMVDTDGVWLIYEANGVPQSCG